MSEKQPAKKSDAVKRNKINIKFEDNKFKDTEVKAEANVGNQHDVNVSVARNQVSKILGSSV